MKSVLGMYINRDFDGVIYNLKIHKIPHINLRDKPGCW